MTVCQRLRAWRRARRWARQIRQVAREANRRDDFTRPMSVHNHEAGRR